MGSMGLLAGSARAGGQVVGADPFFTFTPVCPASDGVFRLGQTAILGIAGDENIEDYRPLINDVLIRVRTELCVLESFIRETATPFIQQKGVGWILPLHETSETYLAGVVFMIGLNFILLGSTKVIAILSIYHDIVLGIPTRALGGFLGLADPRRQEQRFDKELEKVMEEQMKEMKGAMVLPFGREERVEAVNKKYALKLGKQKEKQEKELSSQKDSGFSKVGKTASSIAVPLKLYGTASSTFRQVCEIFDTFCSRYFVAFTVSYIILKTVHYVVFPDFP
eukprot:CAMPEP_0196583636 /NCGR_PEP_ID=MMETSP1081-20130531/44178_1 /TAXON_ID=36882 /ORGANISM="Pyramimonas amylifera, Strain CCMP720" /LENGTH=279 /DNA_ID=CAMNT_0041904583 /DNA_START=426 /DNA_END=1265 /DNA_ORIENTATION=-